MTHKSVNYNNLSELARESVPDETEEDARIKEIRLMVEGNLLDLLRGQIPSDESKPETQDDTLSDEEGKTNNIQEPISVSSTLPVYKVSPQK